jgi:hypothetical protein
MTKSFRLDWRRIDVVDDPTPDFLRQKTPMERLQIAFALWTSTRDESFAYLKMIHPDWNSKMIQKEVAKRLSEIS